MDMYASLMDMGTSLVVEILALVIVCLFFLIFILFEVSVLNIIRERSDPYRVIHNSTIFFAIQAILSLSLIISIYYTFSKTEVADTTEIIEDNESHDTGTTEENALNGLLENNGYRIGSDMLQIPVIEE